mgnify:CR=1 FL=1
MFNKGTTGIIYVFGMTPSFIGDGYPRPPALDASTLLLGGGRERGWREKERVEGERGWREREMGRMREREREIFLCILNQILDNCFKWYCFA